MGKSTNIYDIAQKSGVSIATVSRVLNGSPSVNEITREKVLSVMKEENYTPNAFARGLGLDTMAMVGILCTDISDAYYATGVAMIEQDLRQRGFNTLLCSTGNDLAKKQQCIDLMLEKHVDAIILIGSALREDFDNSHIEKAASIVPVIIINAFIQCTGVTCILCNEQAAVSDAVNALGEHAKDGVLYLYDSLSWSGQEKLAGYKEGLSRLKLPLRNELLIKIPKTLDAAYNATYDLLKRKVSFSAIVASEDLLAVGAQKAVAHFNEDIAIIGCNNSFIARCASPSLTSIDNMLPTLCTTASSLLVDRLNGKSVSDKIVFDAQLVERETFSTTGNDPCAK